MGFKCNEAVDELFVIKMIKDKKLRAKYERNIVESYIEDNKNVKWCSAIPPCGSCIQTNVPLSTMLQVHCRCGHEFCFKCNENAHLPATCEMIAAWNQIMRQYESVEDDYLYQSVKRCPSCKRLVEKNGGCNHMTCQCGFHWCWICTKPFYGYDHACDGHYQPTAFLSTEKPREFDLKKGRFLEYRTYIRNYDKIKKSEDKQIMQMKENFEQYQMDESFVTNADAKLMNDILNIIRLCRNVIRNSCIFEHFMFDQMSDTPIKGIFGCKPIEKHIHYNYGRCLDMIKISIERLSIVFNHSVYEILDIHSTLRSDFKKMIAQANTYLDDFFSVMNEEYMNEENQFPRPKIMLWNTIS
jgi:ariadne-1